ELPRELVRPEQEDLDHVDEDDGDHEVRAPTVEGANEPAGADLLVQGLEPVPRLPGGGDVLEGEQDPGHELEREHGHRRAAEDVEPTRGATRDRVLHRRLDRRAELEPVVEPPRYAPD